MGEKYLGVDYGTRRCGLATASAATRLVSRRGTVPPEQLAAWIEQKGPFVAIVLGLPRSLDGYDTPQTRLVRRFAEEHLQGLGAPLEFQDEAGTSSAAEARLRESGRRYAAGDIDAESAAIILQDYLDTHV